MEAIKNIISIDPEVQDGQPVFKVTKVPVDVLFMHLEQGISINEFLEGFPTVIREQAVALLELGENLVTSKNIKNSLRPLLANIFQAPAQVPSR